MKRHWTRAHHWLGGITLDACEGVMHLVSRLAR